MKVKGPGLLTAAVLVLAGTAAGCIFFPGRGDTPSYTTARAARRDIRVLVSTNGIIEPADRGEVYAPIDGFVAYVAKKDGAEVTQGQLLIRLNSEQVRTALAEANAALLSARREARAVEAGPSKEETAAVEASIAETALQLEQLSGNLASEEALYAKQATTLAAVENLKNQQSLLQLRMDSLKQKRRDLQARYSPEDKAWEQERVAELAKQVASLKRQLDAEAVSAPESGIIYSLQVKQGSYVSKGQLLAQIYKPGRIMLRAYVDEPDLGRIRKGEQVAIEWNGMPNQHWTGLVQRPAEQVVAMNNRSVGEVLCSVENGPPGLIPNLNVNVEITTERKENALVVPRNAVFNSEGKTSVLVPSGKGTVVKAVELGLVTPEEIEIVSGLRDGDSVILNPAENIKP